MNPAEISNSNMASIVSWLAGVVTSLVVIVLPLSYFFISYQHMAGELESETVLIANSVTQEVISSNPELWQYGQTRMEEFLNYRLRQAEIETRRIVINSNEVIAATVGNRATPPLVTRSFPLFDSGVAVGRLEIVRSLRPILVRTALLALFTLPFGAAAYIIMRILPIRSIRRMEEALLKANAELELKVISRTAALDEANKELQTEIEARRLMEAELRESQQYLSAIIQFYPDATIVIDEKGTIVAWNLAVEELTGVRAEEMLGKGDYEYAIPFYGDRRPLLIDLALQPHQEIEAKYTRIERRGNKLMGEAYMQNSSGQKIYFNGIAAPLRNSQGEIIGAIESIRDISERKQMEDRLRALSLGVEQSPASIVITDREGCIEYVNPKFTRLTGYTLAEAIGQNPRILKSGLTRPEVHHQLWETLLCGGEWHGEFCNKKKNGDLYWEFASISPIVDTKGEISRFIAVKEDITEKKNFEEELAERELFLSCILDSIQDSITVLDLDMNIVRVNSALAKDFSDRMPLVGRKCHEVYFGMATPCDNCPSLKTIRSGKPSTKIFSPLGTDNAVWVELLTFPLYDAGKSQITGVIEIARDISAKKIAELALQHKLDFEMMVSSISTLFNKLPAEMIDQGINNSLRIIGEYAKVDRSYLFQFKGNMGMADNTHEWCAEGISPGKENYQGIFPDTDFPWLAKKIRGLGAFQVKNIADLPHEAVIEKVRFKQSGIKSLFIIPLSFDNKIVGFLGMTSLRKEKCWSKDNESMMKIIGEILVNALVRQRGRDEIQKLTEDLERKVYEQTSQLVAAQEELVRKEKLAILGQLSGSVGHELRNPLGVMSNAVYFLNMVHADSDEKTKEYLDIIKHEIDNSQRIITDLLDFARTKTPQTQSISVRELLDKSIGNCVIPATVNLQTEMPNSLPLLNIDPLQMEQVFQNLIINAVQAMPNGGTLRIAANPGLNTQNFKHEGDCIEISLTDTGEGILPENMNKLFQPLYTTKAKGIGLGLVVCRNLVEANGGSIGVVSLPGKGTTFTVLMPVKGE